MNVTTKQKKAFKKITGSKFPKEFSSEVGITIPDYVDFTDDYIVFIDINKKYLKLTISHRMTSDKIICLDQKGELYEN